MENMIISDNDRLILRELAKKQLEMSQNQKNLKRIEEWTAHNDLRGERPMLHLEMWTFAQEILPQRMKCEGEFARSIEQGIYTNFLNQELFDDDRVTPNYYGVGYSTFFKLFNIDIKVQQAFGSDGKASVGHQFEHIINDLEKDYSRLEKSVYGADIGGSLKHKAAIENIIGDILPVKFVGSGLSSVPTQELVHMMGMENMMYNMYDYPELFKEMMGRIADDTLEYFNFLQDNRLLLPTVGNEHLSQGSFCFNTTLPRDKELITVKDIWGFMDSQETVGISPDMYNEFIFPCYEKISSVFGLLSYGCCEPVDPIWDSCISKLKNLRKVSISPWCNEEFMGEQLKGSSVIFHRKPSPNFLGVEKRLDEADFRKHIRKTIKAASGCKLEFAQRDVYTINSDEKKARRYIEIIREEIASYW